MKYILLLILLISVKKLALSQTNYSILADSALKLTNDYVVYDPTYYKLVYPNGDVPKGKGVCTDVIIRAYRKIGIDLQKEVHEDMKAYFYLYPKIWNLKKPDRNIDHRRVPNLMVYMTRKGKDLPLSNYMPGDIICWNLNGSVTHIGIVSNVKNSDGEHYNIIHNIGQGQVLEDCLFSYPIIGHYKY